MKIIQPESVYIDPCAVIGEDVVIYPNNHIIGACVIDEGAVLMPNNIIIDGKIGRGCRVTASYIEDSIVGARTTIGPYAYLRPGSKVGDRCRIGDFVEIKNAEVGDGTKVSHLTYVGDCEIGRDCNIGCGVVFVNYDGKRKQRSNVGDRCFVGSNCNIVAPVALGDECYVAAGTTVTEDVPPESMVIGRVRQIVKPHAGKGRLRPKRIGEA